MIINCVAYHQGTKLRDITTEEISDFVERPDCFVWVALKDAEDAELRKMQEEFSLHPLAVEDALRGHQRPKMEEYGESLFLVAHTLEMGPDGAACTPTVGEVHVFVGKSYLLSARSHSARSLLGVRLRCELAPRLLSQGAGFVLYALLDSVVDSYFPVVQAFESELEAIEEQIFSKGWESANIQQLYNLKRKVGVLRHAVAPLLEAAAKLHGPRAPGLVEDAGEYFRDIHDHLYRINASIDGIRDTVGTAIQVSLSMVTIAQTEVNKRLAAWAAIFAVATAFAGIWGMNFKHMPELEWQWGYPAALTLMGGVCWYLHRRFKRANWL